MTFNNYFHKAVYIQWKQFKEQVLQHSYCNSVELWNYLKKTWEEPYLSSNLRKKKKKKAGLIL